MVHSSGISIPTMFDTYLFPPDVFFRHKVIADAIGRSRQILDVGGSLGELKKFLPRADITTADVVEGADIVFNGKILPVKSESYETVVSVDTLEHIPKKQRMSFVKELYRVAKKQVILLAPNGSVSHLKYEQRLLASYRQQGKAIPRYLDEHVKYGLPEEDFLRELKREFGASVNLCGRLWLDRLNFTIHTFEVKNGKLNQLVYRGKYLWNLFINLFVISIIRRFVPGSIAASRFLVVIDKLNIYSDT